jgi:short-subunit dehydrogenase
MIMKKKTGVDITINNVCPGRVATKEFLADNPKINPQTLVSHEIVYRKILHLINSDSNGEIIPIFPAKLKREILMKEVKRFLF